MATFTVRKIRDEKYWPFPGYGATTSRRRLRVWKVEPGRVVAVVTERPGDKGTSITNAALEALRKLQEEYPDDVTELIEHYVDRRGPDRYASVHFRMLADRPDWRHVEPAELAQRLPGLLG